MDIFFDVDYTILGLDYSLRPGVLETFQKLTADGHRVHVWSGVGLRDQVVKDHKLLPYVSGVYLKPIYKARERLGQLGVPLVPDFVVDDYPEIVEDFGGVCVWPYYMRNDQDTQMERIYRIASDFARDGVSPDRQFVRRKADPEDPELGRAE